ncbi:MAG: serine hydrolase [Candidatus Heimdallarchaeota archaeon]|nr:MAG: serine hydrolase [Candidatus Heimdallarchaeota archaeon]
MKKAFIFLIFGLFFQTVLFSPIICCLASANSAQELNKHWPTNEWKDITPKECGLNPTYFDQLTSTLENGTIPAYSIVIANTDGYILYEWNLVYFDENKTHKIYSVTKGIIGLLIGIAIDNGFIESVDVPISNYFNSSEWQNPDPRKEEITIRHLLTFTAGIEYDELSTPYSDPENDFNVWTSSSDWVQFALDLPMNADPGQQFTFCSAASHLLSAILYKATNKAPLDFANQYLFDPIGVNIGHWSTGSGGIHNGGNGITMTTRDMARIGYLVFNNGTWNETQIISEEWIKESTQPQFHDFFGYQWWILPEEEFGKGATYAAGAYTNKVILVLREYGFVISIIAEYGEGAIADCHKKLVTDYLIPATLPYNPESNTSDTTNASTLTTKTSDMNTSSFYALFILPGLWILVYFKKKRELI